MILGATIRLRDNFTTTMRRARQETSQFRQDVENARRQLREMRNQRVQARIELANQRIRSRLDAIRQRLEPLRSRIVTVIAWRDMITNDIRRVTSRLNLFGRMVFRPVIGVTDRATRVIGKIKDSLLSLKGLAAVALVGLGAEKTVSGAMMLEQQQISMQHFIGIQNKGMDAAEVKKQSDEYVEWLRSYANLTPFGTDEVIGGGARAINIAGGDVAKAKELAKIAGDMAALNPEKSYSDAMEALADLRVGETERMKEFGFKISQEDIKAAGGVENVIKNQIEPFFKGGAEKLSQSSAGLWSTITGNMGTMLTTVGTGILQGLKPQLQKAVDWISSNGEKITAISTSIGRGIGGAIQTASNIIGQYGPIIKSHFSSIGSTIGPVFDWIKEQMPAIKTAMSSVLEYLPPIIDTVKNTLGILGNAWVKIWPTISSILKTAWKIVRPILDTAISMVRILGKVFETVWPGIVKVIETAWAVLKPIFNGIAGGLELIAKGFKWVAEKLGASPSEVKVVAKGGGGKSKGHATPYATGGLITRPHLGLVGEAGPEVIIPLSRRNRAIELWQRTGEMLGIPMHANGGFFGSIKKFFGSEKVQSIGNSTEYAAIGMESTRKGQEKAVHSIHRNYEKKIKGTTTINEAEKVRRLAHSAINLNRSFGKITKVLSRVAIPLSLFASASEIIGSSDKKQAFAKEFGSILGAIGAGALTGAATGALVGAGVLSPFTALIGSVIGAGTGALGGQALASKMYGRYVKGHASGLPYIPYDNYPAMLHKGETVLSRSDADNYRSNRQAPTQQILHITIHGMNKTTRQIFDEIMDIAESDGMNMGNVSIA